MQSSCRKMPPPAASSKAARSCVIRGFTVDVDTRAIGYQIRAMVRIRPITGDDPFLARLVVQTIEQMDDVLEVLLEHVVTSMAVIKGTSVKRRLPPL